MPRSDYRSVRARPSRAQHRQRERSSGHGVCAGDWVADGEEIGVENADIRAETVEDAGGFEGRVLALRPFPQAAIEKQDFKSRACLLEIFLQWRSRFLLWLGDPIWSFHFRIVAERTIFSPDLCIIFCSCDGEVVILSYRAELSRGLHLMCGFEKC